VHQIHHFLTVFLIVFAYLHKFAPHGFTRRGRAEILREMGWSERQKQGRHRKDYFVCHSGNFEIFRRRPAASVSLAAMARFGGG
jgi:hypothetical protein